MQLEAFSHYSTIFLFQKSIIPSACSIIRPRIPPSIGDKLQINLSIVVPLLTSLIKRIGPSIGMYMALELIGKIVTPVNCSIDWVTPANLEYLMFGKVLALEIQTFRTYFLDCLFNATYLLHPFYLMIVLLILYKKDRVVSEHFSRATIVTCYIGFLVFLFYPVAPPWLVVKGIENTPRTLMNTVSASLNLPVTYDGFNPAVYAAIPSLHCALAWTSTLCMRKLGKAYGFAMFLFTLCVWIGTVYTGNHFIIDIILGVILATVTYRLTDSSNFFYRTLSRWRKILTSKLR